VDGKLWRENEKENFFERVWFGGEEGRKINGGTYVFFLQAYQKSFFQK